MQPTFSHGNITRHGIKEVFILNLRSYGPALNSKSSQEYVLREAACSDEAGDIYLSSLHHMESCEAEVHATLFQSTVCCQSRWHFSVLAHALVDVGMQGPISFFTYILNPWPVMASDMLPQLSVRLLQIGHSDHSWHIFSCLISI
jgi:hypothetical protein